MRKRGHVLFKLFMCAFAVLALYSIINQQVVENNQQKRLAEIESQVEAYRDRVDELEYDLSVCDTEEYYAKVAREKLGYYFYGDEVFINDRD